MQSGGAPGAPRSHCATKSHVWKSPSKARVSVRVRREMRESQLLREGIDAPRGFPLAQVRREGRRLVDFVGQHLETRGLGPRHRLPRQNPPPTLLRTLVPPYRCVVQSHVRPRLTIKTTRPWSIG